jgi:hypothetical protein
MAMNANEATAIGFTHQQKGMTFLEYGLHAIHHSTAKSIKALKGGRALPAIAHHNSLIAIVQI